jgi:hypothetical protein
MNTESYLAALCRSALQPLSWSQNKIDGSSQTVSGSKACLGDHSRRVQGNLCFPLTLTYHGCPLFFVPVVCTARLFYATPVSVQAKLTLARPIA